MGLLVTAWEGRRKNKVGDGRHERNRRKDRPFTSSVAMMSVIEPRYSTDRRTAGTRKCPKVVAERADWSLYHQIRRLRFFSPFFFFFGAFISRWSDTCDCRPSNCVEFDLYTFSRSRSLGTENLPLSPPPLRRPQFFFKLLISFVISPVWTRWIDK